MTKRGHKCDDCKDGKCETKTIKLDKLDIGLKPLLENQVEVEWDFNTYELTIMIRPKSYLMTDISKPDQMTNEEVKARAHFELYKKAIIDSFNKHLKEIDK
jgi:hypothetical protein